MPEPVDHVWSSAFFSSLVSRACYGGGLAGCLGGLVVEQSGAGEGDLGAFLAGFRFVLA